MRRQTRGTKPTRLVALSSAAVVAAYYGPAVLERFLPRPALRRFQQMFGNPGGRMMSRVPGWALLETTGRRSGHARQVPIGGRVLGDSCWLVAVDPQHAGYVRNLVADPRVRVKVGGRWRTGIAHLVPDDNPRTRMFILNPVNGLYITIAGRRFLLVRVELDS